MSNDLQQCTLGKFAPLLYGKGLPKNQRNRSGQVPVYGSSGITDWHDACWVSSEGIIVGRKGTIGSIYYSDSPFYPIDTTFYIEPAPHRDLRFTYYLLQTLGLERMNSDSAVPGLNRDAAHGRLVRVPCFPEQKAIASILGTLDEKIKLNRRMNETLEEMAQAIFKSWFVDLDPVRAKSEGQKPDGMGASVAALFPEKLYEIDGNEVPEGWEVRPLSRIAHFLNGVASQKYPPESQEQSLPVIKISELRKGFTESSGKANSKIDQKYIVDDGDVIFSWSGSLELILWGHGRGVLNQHLFKVTSQEFPKWLYYFWTKQHLLNFRRIAADKATTMGHIQRHHLTEAQVFVPPPVLLNRAHEVIAPMLDKIIGNQLENRTLVALRDTLLPKLISGEIRVAEAEREVEEVL